MAPLPETVRVPFFSEYFTFASEVDPVKNSVAHATVASTTIPLMIVFLRVRIVSSIPIPGSHLPRYLTFDIHSNESIRQFIAKKCKKIKLLIFNI